MHGVPRNNATLTVIGRSGNRTKEAPGHASLNYGGCKGAVEISIARLRMVRLNARRSRTYHLSAVLPIPRLDPEIIADHRATARP
jgi:uncharacterized protein YbcC (UPF0753/DUF2309 family)